MMNDNPVKYAKTDILAFLSEKLKSPLRTDRCGLAVSHSSGVSRWVDMDRNTCALVFDFSCETDFEFELVEYARQSCLHSLYIFEGNVKISSIDLNGSLHVKPKEYLQFQSSAHPLRIMTGNGNRLKMVLISHCFGRSPHFKGFAQRQHTFYMDACKKKCRETLTKIFEPGLDRPSGFALKGSLFLLLEQSLPVKKLSAEKLIPKKAPETDSAPSHSIPIRRMNFKQKI